MIPRTLLRPLLKFQKKITLLLLSVVVLIVLIIALLVAVTLQYRAKNRTTNTATAVQVYNRTQTIEKQKQAYKFNAIKDVISARMDAESLVGEGVYVVAWDTKNHNFYDLFDQNVDKPYNAASVTKLVTALTLAKQGKMTESLVGDEAGVPGLPEGEVSGDFRGQTFPQADLVAALLIQSSNQAAYSLAHPTGTKKFVSEMNREASKLGMSRSILRDPSGYDFGQKQLASYMSPRDVARVAFELVSRFPDVAKLTSEYRHEIKNKKGGRFMLRNTNPLVQNTTHTLLSKTGYTSLAGGNLAMVREVRPGIMVAYIVMKSTVENRFTDMSTLLKITDQAFDAHDMFVTR